MLLAVQMLPETEEWTLNKLMAIAKSRIDSDTKFIGFSHMSSF